MHLPRLLFCALLGFVNGMQASATAPKQRYYHTLPGKSMASLSPAKTKLCTMSDELFTIKTLKGKTLKSWHDIKEINFSFNDHYLYILKKNNEAVLFNGANMSEIKRWQHVESISFNPQSCHVAVVTAVKHLPKIEELSEIPPFFQSVQLCHAMANPDHIIRELTLFDPQSKQQFGPWKNGSIALLNSDASLLFLHNKQENKFQIIEPKTNHSWPEEVAPDDSLQVQLIDDDFFITIEGELCIFDTKKKEGKLRVPNCLSYKKINDHLLLTSCITNVSKVCNLKEAKQLTLYDLEKNNQQSWDNITYFEILKDRLFMFDTRKMAAVIDLSTGEEIMPWEEFNFNKLYWSAEGTYLLAKSYADDNNISHLLLYNIEKKEVIKDWEQQISDCFFSPNGELVIIQSSDEEGMVISTTTGDSIASWEKPTAITCSPTSGCFVSIDTDSLGSLYDKAGTLLGSWQEVNQCFATPDGFLLKFPDDTTELLNLKKLQNDAPFLNRTKKSASNNVNGGQDRAFLKKVETNKRIMPRHYAVGAGLVTAFFILVKLLNKQSPINVDPLLIKAIGNPINLYDKVALDFSGALGNIAHFLKNEWTVWAGNLKDYYESLFESKDLAPLRHKVTVINSPLTALPWPLLPTFGLINAGSCLSELTPEPFLGTWNKVYNALQKNGVLVATFYAEDHKTDAQKSVLSFTKEKLYEFLNQFEIIDLEENRNVKSGNHTFTVIARKR